MVPWTPLLVVAGLALLTHLYFAKVRKWLRIYRAISAIPRPEPGHWLSGNSEAFVDRVQLRERRLGWRKAHPRIYHLDAGLGTLMVFVPNPETVAPIFRSSNCPKDSLFYGNLKPWLGDGLLVSRGKKWARDRRLLTNCFHFDILRGYVDVYTDAVNVMLRKWADASANGKSVDVTSSCTMLTLDIIMRCAMGFESNCQLELDNVEISQEAAYAEAVVKISHAMLARAQNVLHMLMSNFLYLNFTSNGRDLARLLKTIHGMSQHLIQERRAALQDDTSTGSRKRYRDFLDVLLTVKDEDGIGLSDTEIREQVDTFLFRGHDTTASAMQWTIYYLAQHEDLQEKCRHEVTEVLQQDTEGSALGTLTHEKLGELKYLTQFIKETLRIASSVPFSSRELGEDMNIDGYHLPAGTLVEIAYADIHMAEEYWPEPFKFDPDRFSPEQNKGQHPFAFVPFSAGPRNCIGQSMAMDELKTTTALILSQFQIHPDPKQPDPQWVPAMIARPLPNIKVCLSPV